LAGDLAAQTSEQGEGGRGYFAAPFAKYTVIHDHGAFMLGGRGGFNLTSCLVVGGSLYGTLTEIDAPDEALTEVPGPLDVEFDCFGADVEYHIRPNASTHFTVNGFIGGGAVRFERDKTDEQMGESDFLFVLEPGVGVEQRVTGWFHLHLALSYRMVTGLEQRTLENADFSGPGVALSAKLGRF